MENKEEQLAKLIFPENLPLPEEILDRYPTRNLEGGRRLTRYAPSPTGFMHLGNLYSALVSERIAHRSGGIFLLRLEDTDDRRAVPGAVEKIVSTLEHFQLQPDEGYDGFQDKGVYGPYQQSSRQLIYKVFAKNLVEKGLAYPCFCNVNELEQLTLSQKGTRTGYYGSWARCRHINPILIQEKIQQGIPFALRFKSPGNFAHRLVVHDQLRGNLDYPENDLDIVLLKQNGMPTYHFAHVVDDFLMGTNLVIRGDEWLPSLPLHLQLFAALGWKAPKYAHISPILKMEGNIKRKLSKRKDPEANVEYFSQLGYPTSSVLEYLLNIANSNFEDWRRQNPKASRQDFPFELRRLNTSGALFDLGKLNSISRQLISTMTAAEVYQEVFTWSHIWDPKVHQLLNQYPEKVRKIFAIERENTKNIRKDLTRWSDVYHEINYFFELKPDTVLEQLQQLPPLDTQRLTRLFLENYREKDTREEWFERIRTIASQCSCANSMQEFHANPQKFAGSLVDVTRLLRILVTGHSQGPDLYSILAVLGKNTLEERLTLGLDLTK